MTAAAIPAEKWIKVAPASSMKPVRTIQLHCKIFQARGVTIPGIIAADAMQTTVRDRSKAAPAMTAGPMRNVAAINKASEPRGLASSRQEPWIAAPIAQ